MLLQFGSVKIARDRRKNELFKGDFVSKNRSVVKTDLLTTPKDFFTEKLELSLKSCRVDAKPPIKNYLINLLEYYLDSKNLFEAEYDELGKRRPQTLAEIFLEAQNSEPSVRFELLKKLGDRTLYVSGFFGDSLGQKIVDIDYYSEMGMSAYSQLATLSKDDLISQVFKTFAKRFLSYVDVLTFISHNSFVQSDESILRLYDRYLRTGSPLAKEKLFEMGVLTFPEVKRKSIKIN